MPKVKVKTGGRTTTGRPSMSKARAEAKAKASARKPKPKRRLPKKGTQ